MDAYDEQYLRRIHLLQGGTFLSPSVGRLQHKIWRTRGVERAPTLPVKSKLDIQWSNWIFFWEGCRFSMSKIKFSFTETCGNYSILVETHKQFHKYIKCGCVEGAHHPQLILDWNGYNLGQLRGPFVFMWISLITCIQNNLNNKNRLTNGIFINSLLVVRSSVIVDYVHDRPIWNH